MFLIYGRILNFSFSIYSLLLYHFCWHPCQDESLFCQLFVSLLYANINSLRKKHFWFGMKIYLQFHKFDIKGGREHKGRSKKWGWVYLKIWDILWYGCTLDVFVHALNLPVWLHSQIIGWWKSLLTQLLINEMQIIAEVVNL